MDSIETYLNDKIIKYTIERKTYPEGGTIFRLLTKTINTLQTRLDNYRSEVLNPQTQKEAKASKKAV